MIEVMLVDDHDLVRMGIRSLLESVSDIKVAMEAQTGEEAIRAARQKRPDVVLMDINMPGIGGLETTRKLLQIYPDLPVIIVTAHTDDPYPSHLLRAGARGYITKGSQATEMVAAIRQVFHGQRYLSPDVAQSLALSLLPGSQSSPFEQLSQREMQVLLMLIQGERVQEISEKLHLSPKTISTYRHRLFEKLQVKSDAELTRLAMRHGIIEQ